MFHFYGALILSAKAHLWYRAKSAIVSMQICSETISNRASIYGRVGGILNPFLKGFNCFDDPPPKSWEVEFGEFAE